MLVYHPLTAPMSRGLFALTMQARSRSIVRDMMDWDSKLADSRTRAMSAVGNGRVVLHDMSPSFWVRCDMLNLNVLRFGSTTTIVSTFVVLKVVARGSPAAPPRGSAAFMALELRSISMLPSMCLRSKPLVSRSAVWTEEQRPRADGEASVSSPDPQTACV